MKYQCFSIKKWIMTYSHIFLFNPFCFPNIYLYLFHYLHNLQFVLLQSISISNSSNMFTQSQNQDPRPIVMFVLGGPGSGKGTQCTIIKQKYEYANFVHLSTGSLLRTASQTKSPVNQEINKLMKEGKMVPSPPLVRLIKERIENDSVKQDKTQKEVHPYIFIIDGFPRNTDNLKAWNEIIGDSFNVKFLLYFEVPEEELRKRLFKRAETSGRADDNPETIEKRLKTFYGETYPMLDFFDKSGGQTIRINGRQGIDEVARDVTIQLKKFRMI